MIITLATSHNPLKKAVGSLMGPNCPKHIVLVLETFAVHYCHQNIEGFCFYFYFAKAFKSGMWRDLLNYFLDGCITKSLGKTLGLLGPNYQAKWILVIVPKDNQGPLEIWARNKGVSLLPVHYCSKDIKGFCFIYFKLSYLVYMQPKFC